MPATRYQFRDLAPGVHFATASDRYAGWIGQIYTEDRDYKIKRSKRSIKGVDFAEEKLPVRSVVEYFQHYSALEIDFTFYAYLLDAEGQPTRNYAPLAEYAQWLPADAMVILKVPEAICATKRWRSDGGRRAVEDNPDYLNAEKFVERFYEPAISVLGSRIRAFSFEKGYQRKDDCPSPEENITRLQRFFGSVPADDRYHIEERTDRLKTEDYFIYLHQHGIGNVFSHWTWLPDLKTQWEQVGGFTNPSLGITRLLTPLRMGYDETYARYHPFDKLKDEFEQMYRDAAFIIKSGRQLEIPVVTVVNNRAGGNAPEITRRVAEEMRGLL